MKEVPERTASRRLFVALPVPADFAVRMVALPRDGVAGRWSQAGDLHITLRFLGDLPSDAAGAVEQALARVRRPPFHIEVDGLGMFDKPRQTVLYARIGSTRKLNALCGDITDLLAPLGFDFRMRPFVPHITLARLDKKRGAREYIEKYEKTVSGRWQAGSFSLMCSAGADSAGHRYGTVARYALLS